MLKKSGLVVLIILLLGQLAWAAETPIDANPEQLLGFAQHLFETEEYYRAITEYQRFIFLYPEHSRTPGAHFQIGACYFGGGQWQEAVKVWQANLGHSLPPELRRQTLYQLAAGYYKLEQYRLCRQYLEQLRQEYPQNPLRLSARKLLTASYLAQERWGDAARTVQQMELPQAEELSRQVAQAQELPLKSPGLAGGLSAILPGAGQLYAGRSQDAIMAFLLNGLFIWGTVEAFSHDKPVTGVILLFFESGWYFGNIYSATSSAHKYNRKLKQDFHRGAQERLQFKLGVPQAGPLGLSLSYSF